MLWMFPQERSDMIKLAGVENARLDEVESRLRNLKKLLNGWSIYLK